MSSIDLQCMCSESMILAVHLSRSVPPSRFTEQLFSTSRFKDTRNGWSQLRKNKFAPHEPTTVSASPRNKHIIWTLKQHTLSQNQLDYHWDKGRKTQTAKDTDSIIRQHFIFNPSAKTLAMFNMVITILT